MNPFKVGDATYEAPPYLPPTKEEIAERVAFNKWFAEEARKSQAMDPLPDNFIDLVRGKTNIPVYSS